MPKKINKQRLRCPCGCIRSLAQCCDLYISKQQTALTAEALMRSRYSAYVLGEVDYLLDSWSSLTRPQQLELNTETHWKRLQLIECVAGGVDDGEGIVEFIATYKHQGKTQKIQERSRFIREQDLWVYWGEMT